MLGCLLAIEEIIQNPPKQNQLNIGYQVIFPKPNALALVLKNAIYTIVTNFYEYLSQFSFPPKYAYKLQSFVDFKE